MKWTEIDEVSYESDKGFRLVKTENGWYGIDPLGDPLTGVGGIQYFRRMLSAQSFADGTYKGCKPIYDKAIKEMLKAATKAKRSA